MADLEIGEIYFVVMFEDDALQLPIIATARLTGIEAMPNGNQRAWLEEHEFSGEIRRTFYEAEDLTSHLLDRAQLLQLLQASFEGTLPYKGTSS